MTPLAFHLAAAVLPFGSFVTLPPIDLHATSFTVATYVNVDDTNQRNIVLGNWSSHANAWQMLFAVNAGGQTAINLRRDMKANGSDPFQDLVSLVSQKSIAPQEWHHIAVTFDWGQDAKSPKATLYIDGEADASVAPVVKPDRRIQNLYMLKRSPNAYLLGRKEDTNSENDWFAGQLCEYRVYTQALDAQGIRSMVRNARMPHDHCGTQYATPYPVPHYKFSPIYNYGHD